MMPGACQTSSQDNLADDTIIQNAVMSTPVSGSANGYRAVVLGVNS